ncbi:MAG: PAS domain-containing sensor histidine kinase [Coriobacteriia bacterium]|nr:PAS domain-containing sensor histidine kinase [Coriobacteriia bacterium]
MDHAGHDRSDVSRYFAVLAEAMPCPVVQLEAGGRVSIANTLGRRLLARPGRESEPRLLLADGRDFWEIIEDAVARGEPLLEGSARIRTQDAQTAAIWYTGFPARGVQGSASTAVLVVYDASDEKLVALETRTTEDVGIAVFDRVATDLAAALPADAVVVAELGPDRSRSARLLAAFVDGAIRRDVEWDLGPSPAPSAPSRPIVVVKDDLATRYGDDAFAVERGFRSFAGALVVGADGERLGVLGAYFARPIEDPAPVRGILRLFAAGVAPALLSLRAERALRESEKRATALFAHGHMPILLIEPSSTQIVEANPAASALYGMSADELVTMSMLQFAPESPESLRAEIRSAAAGLRDYFVCKQLLRGREVRELEVFAGPLAMGGRTLVYAVLHDVTEKRRSEAELARYRHELEALVQRRTSDLLDAASTIEVERERRAQLYRDMGLELRTPLQTILGFSEALAKGLAGRLNPEQAKQVQMIGDSAKKLAALVEDILELSRLEAGGASDLRIEPFDLRHLAESVAISAQAEAEEKGLRVSSEVPDEPIDVETDRTKLEQILAELVSNALKYTPSGAVVVRAVPGAGAEAIVEVSDTGIGIPADELPHIFDEFRHLRTEGTAHAGTGLGLALCKRLAEAIGGRIEVESEAGRGSTFRVRFPGRHEAGDTRR